MENTCFSLKTERKPLNGEICINSLLFALRHGHAGIVEYLLSKGANPDGFIDPGCTQPAPIFIAIENNRLDLVKLLHEYKASLGIMNKRHTKNGVHLSPLIYAIIDNHSTEITQFLIKNTKNAARRIRIAIDKCYASSDCKDTSILVLLENAYHYAIHKRWPNLFQPSSSGSNSSSSSTTQFGLTLRAGLVSQESRRMTSCHPFQA